MRRSDLFRHYCSHSLRNSGCGTSQLSRQVSFNNQFLRQSRVILRVVSQNGPTDSCQFVGHSDSGSVFTSSLADSIDPATEWILPINRMANNGSGTMNQKFAKISISSFADPQQESVATAAILPRDQPKGSCGMTAPGISTAITDSATEGARNDRSESWDGLQPLAGLVLLA
jgi:hypothetical protein